MTALKRLLLVEDDRALAELVTFHFDRAGYQVTRTGDGEEALILAEEIKPDLILLDWMIEGISGIEVCRRLRRRPTTANVPIIMLTARGEEDDRIRGLETGADDYLTKPFSPAELVLRVKAILRRTGAAPEADDVVNVGSISINRAAHGVSVRGAEVDLTPTEYKLLLLLAERRGRVQARSHLLQSVWDAAPDIQTRTVDMHVQRLRTKLGPDGDVIETVRGFGYRIRPGSAKDP